MILGADHPYNHVTCAISRGSERRAATASTPGHIPTAGDRRRICRSDAQSRKHGVTVVVRAQRDIGALFCAIGDRCLNDSSAGNHRFGYGRADSAEVVSIKQIHFKILTQGNHEVGRRCTGHIHQQWAGAAHIEVEIVMSEPVFGRPVIGWRTTKDRAGLEADHCFAAVPGASGIKRVSSRNKWIFTIAGDPADPPYGAAVGTWAGVRSRRPCCYYAGWIRIIYRDAYEPAMKGTAIGHTPIANVKNIAHDAECWPLLLNRRVKVY